MRGILGAGAFGALLLAAGGMAAYQAPERNAAAPDVGWEVYGGGYDNIKYSPLAQIDAGNVGRLKLAWRYDSGDAFPDSEIETNPLVIGGVLYAVTPRQVLTALDAADGHLLWRFDPNPGEQFHGPQRSRGLASWSDGHARTIFHGSGSWLYAIDAATGRPRAGFGTGGRIDLRAGLGRDAGGLSVSATSPGVVWKDLLIIGSSTAEDLPAAPGDVRAYDVRSGALRWSFRTIPAPGEAGSKTWPAGARRTSGSANSWAGLSLDVRRGIVFVPTGSAAFDFWGGDRKGNNLYADSLIALDAASGRRLWHFQSVRHDIWDRDLPSPPSLVRIRRGGRTIDAVAQITKTGYVYLFDPATGAPLTPIREVPVPRSDVPGEEAARSEPLPAGPSFTRQNFDASQVTSRTPEARAAVMTQLGKLRYGGPFAPPSFQGTVFFPGLDGGGEWGGAAFDPATGLLYVNANQMAWIVRLVKRQQQTGGAAASATGSSLYQANCSGCHRPDLAGTPPDFPSLRDLSRHMDRAQVEARISHGAARMPAFAGLGRDAIAAIAAYVLSGESRSVAGAGAGGNRLPFGIDGYNRFLDPDGYPAISPPWGLLTAIDLNRGRIAWQVPLGEVPALVAQGVRGTGSENYGGPVVTAGGLLFIGATTLDHKLRAFDKRTGRLLWEAELPAAATATPAVYSVHGREYVAIACGGGKSRQPSGASYVAFALPD